MQLFSLHHCVLFFILTFTTAPVSAIETCPTRGKLHQPVTLSCTYRCPGLFEWNLLSKRDVVLAQCDQASCWAEKGFSISHDQYLKGDFSLTITKADYSQRNVYVCECDHSDYARVRLVIETVVTPVQMKYDEDLKLKVSVPEPVEVIYKSSDAADEVICNVTKDSLQCKDDYRHRTSLTYPELTLKHMMPRDSGSYTIRDTKYNEDIQIYDVFVEEKPGFPAWGIVLIMILLCCCVGAGIFLLYKHRMRKQLERRLQQVDQLVQEAEGGTEEKIREAETSVDQLQQQYNKTVYKDQVKVFCSEKRRQLLERRQQLVNQLVQVAVGVTEEIREVEKSLDQLQQQYNNTEYKDKVKVFCREKREQLLERRQQQVNKLVQVADRGMEEEIREAEKTLKQLQQQYNGTVYKVQVNFFCSEKRIQLINSLLLSAVELLQKPEEWKKEDIEHLERKLNWLMSLYRNSEHFNDVLLLCMEQRSQISWNRLQYSKEEPFMTTRIELNRKLLIVEQLVKQAEAGTKEITEAEKAIDELEQQYNYTEYSKQVFMLCEVKKKQLKHLDSDKGLIDQNSKLNSQAKEVEQFVQQAKEGEEKKIIEAEKKISQLGLEYYTTEYSGIVSFFCMIKRAELYWYRLLLQ